MNNPIPPQYRGLVRFAFRIVFVLVNPGHSRRSHRVYFETVNALRPHLVKVAERLSK